MVFRRGQKQKIDRWLFKCTKNRARLVGAGAIGLENEPTINDGIIHETQRRRDTRGADSVYRGSNATRQAIAKVWRIQLAKGGGNGGKKGKKGRIEGRKGGKKESCGNTCAGFHFTFRESLPIRF